MKEFDRIPKEVYLEAEKYGILESEILFAAASDKNSDGVFCDNWVLVTEEEIIQIGGINVVLPDETKRRRDPKRLTVKYTNISLERMEREGLHDFKVEKLISGCIMTAVAKEGNYKLITYLTGEREGQFNDLCKELNAKEQKEEIISEENREEHHMPPPPPHGGGPGGPPPHGGHGPKGGPKGKGDKRDDNYCPKCGRRYSDPHNKLCLHCVDKSSVVKRLFSFMKKYRFSVVLILLAMGLTSALSVISPYISSQFFYDQVLTVGGEFYGRVLLVIFLVVSLRVGALLVEMVSNIITARVVPKVVYDLKKTIFSSIERLSLSFFTNRRTGALMNQVNGDANTIYWFFVEGLPYLIVNVIQTVAVAVIMAFIDYRLFIIAVIFCPIAFFAVKWLFGVTKKLHARRFSASRSLTGLLADVLGGVRVVKAFAREEEEVSRFDKASMRLAKAERTSMSFELVAFPGVTFMFVISSALVTGIGGWLVMTDSITYGTLLAFLSYTSMLYSPLMFFVNVTQTISNTFNATYRLTEVMDAEPEVMEKEDALELSCIDGRVTFEDVCFGYDKSRRVIDNVSFDIEAGKKIGIVGHTGAGKSTLANLLIRLYDVDDGKIMIDGHDVRALSFKSLRENIAIVSQETYLFQGTILDNIKYAKPDATMEEVINASKISGAHDFIIKLPDGYSTKLGWGFRELSGGERQRVSIARAILRDPKILIMDEATSAMDTRTERAIQEALEKLTEGRTTIMIAHRLSTLRDCEKLLVIENGKVAEAGTHKELIVQKGIYFKLYTLQYEALKNAGIEE